jgi:hypothetical protein
MYYWLIYDPTIPTQGGRIYNIGRMNDRTTGIIVGIAMMMGGLMLLQMNPRKNFTTANLNLVGATWPAAPQGFNQPIDLALKYRPVISGSPNQSYPHWHRLIITYLSVNHIGISPTNLQYDWGYQLSLSPDSFVAWVSYVEAHRAALVFQRRERFRALISMLLS